MTSSVSFISHFWSVLYNSDLLLQCMSDAVLYCRWRGCTGRIFSWWQSNMEESKMKLKMRENLRHAENSRYSERKNHHRAGSSREKGRRKKAATSNQFLKQPRAGLLVRRSQKMSQFIGHFKHEEQGSIKENNNHWTKEVPKDRVSKERRRRKVRTGNKDGSAPRHSCGWEREARQHTEQKRRDVRSAARWTEVRGEGCRVYKAAKWNQRTECCVLERRESREACYWWLRQKESRDIRQCVNFKQGFRRNLNWVQNQRNPSKIRRPIPRILNSS